MEVLEGLNDLLQLDHDAIGAYEIAIERLENSDYATQIEGFKKDHERHVRALNDLILDLGGEPQNRPHATAPLKRAIQRVAAAGGDKALLAGWRANELQVMMKYDRYAHRANEWPAEVKRIVDENALDEERHYQWVVDIMGDGEAPEVHAANQFRERVSTAGSRLDRAMEAVRMRTADGLEVAAARLDALAGDSNSDGTRGAAFDGAHRVARGMNSAAHILRHDEGYTIQGSIENEIRTNPARALIATFALGFMIGRILR